MVLSVFLWFLVGDFDIEFFGSKDLILLVEFVLVLVFREIENDGKRFKCMVGIKLIFLL